MSHTQTPAGASRVYTVEEAAGLLGVSPRTVYDWVNRGKIAAIRPGGRAVRILRAPLDAMLAGGATAPADDPLG